VRFAVRCDVRSKLTVPVRGNTTENLPLAPPKELALPVQYSLHDHQFDFSSAREKHEYIEVTIEVLSFLVVAELMEH
jgi:hypothetical protein